jgi:heat shock protein HtpX
MDDLVTMPPVSTPRDQTSAGGLDPAEQISANRKRSAAVVGLLGAAAGLVVVVIGLFVLPWAVALLIGFVAGGAAGWAAAVGGPSRALRLAGGRPVDPVAEARLINVVEGLSLAAGVPQPELFVLDDPACNALTVGADPRRARLLVTSGLLDSLTRIELEGVLAHELSHIRTYDIRSGSLAAGLVSLAGPLAGPAEAAARWLVGSQRETLADLRAISLTRYPPGLIAALEALRTAETAVVGQSPALLPLCFMPGASARGPDAADDQPTLDARIEALREL